MARTLKSTLDAKNEIAAANYPEIRHITIPRYLDILPHEDIKKTKWVSCSPKTASHFTAVGYFFARRLYKELDVPIGLLNSSWGSTRIEPWTPPVGFEAVPRLKKICERISIWDTRKEKGRKILLSFIANMKTWMVNAEKALAANKQVSSFPSTSAFKATRFMPTVLYNTMINPLVPYAIRGAIWYQGEQQASDVAYYYKMQALVAGWRKVWNQGDFPFYYVQLPNYKRYSKSPAKGDYWIRARDAQLRALDIPKTGMAVTIDIGDAKDVHPKNKQDVGERLALWALAIDYRRNIIYSGPLYKKNKIEGNKIRVYFDHAESGLMVGDKNGLKPTKEVPNGKLKHFVISDQGGKWHWADAKIDGTTVLVSSAKVKKPKAVRYAWNPGGTNYLYNKKGLPASPFRTDK